VASALQQSEAQQPVQEDADGEDDFGDEDDVDDIDQQYAVNEIPVVQNAVSLITLAFRITKLSLAIMTAVADSTPDAAVSSVFINLPAQSSAAGSDGLMKWVGAVVARCQDISRNVTDFGCELYPPIDTETLDSPKLELISCLRQSLGLLENFSSQESIAALRTELLCCQEALGNLL
jgi:hypothetical protein